MILSKIAGVDDKLEIRWSMDLPQSVLKEGRILQQYVQMMVMGAQLDHE
jgi:hypothetical protein